MLEIDQETRNELRTAAVGAHAPAGAGTVAGHGTIYYGEVYGRSPATDTYYVLALIDQMYVWQQQGEGPWIFKGGFDARKCAPPIPPRLYTAWGVGGFPKKRC